MEFLLIDIAAAFALVLSYWTAVVLSDLARSRVRSARGVRVGENARPLVAATRKTPKPRVERRVDRRVDRRVEQHAGW